ncbi:MAG: TadE/TadG family type IV pilus assembly protein [Chloroflexota bacterium]
MARRLARGWKRFLSDDRGAEVVQFALVIPLVVGIIWFSIEAWQLMSLRAALRSAVTQAARLVTAYAAPPDELDEPLPPAAVCASLEELLVRSLGELRGPLGDAVRYDVRLYRIKDPDVSAWSGNATELDCLSLMTLLQCNDQFAVELNARVPWQKILFGLGGVSRESFALNLSDVAMGTAPCMPFMNVENVTATVLASGPGGCRANVTWSINSSFVPNRIEVYVGSSLACEIFNPETVTFCAVALPPNRTSTVMVRAYGRAPSGVNPGQVVERMESGFDSVGCLVGGP